MRKAKRNCSVTPGRVSPAINPVLSGGNARLEWATVNGQRHGRIRSQNRGRTRAPVGADRKRVLRGRGSRPLRAARFPGLLGQAPGCALRRIEPARQGQARAISYLQFAIPYLDQGRTADFEFSGFADQAAAESVSAKPVAER